ncbi:MAG: COX15/CtaA family protein [Gemmatimonadota bacterium]|nr:MAG: COX15/CtaA family protein [Gemmatimonadota bacterium]
MKTLRVLSYTAVGFAYALIVLGGVVRITGSGLGCGDDWPLCNGRLIPHLDDYRTLLEWGHRQVAVILTVLTAAVGIQAVRTRSEPEVTGPGGIVYPAILAVLLLLVQILLGAVTVIRELPPATVILHLGVAMALIATLLVTALRADTNRKPCSGLLPKGSITAAAILGGTVILLGGLTANLGAIGACLGFPLCNGQLWPTGGAGGLAHIHWTHRLLAFALLFHLLGIVVRLRMREAPSQVKDAAWIAFNAALVQTAIAAVMILSMLQPVWRMLHVAVGTALWVALVYTMWLVTDRPDGPVTRYPGVTND